jgi:hypothetical protein
MHSSLKTEDSEIKGETKCFKIHNQPLEPNYYVSWVGIPTSTVGFRT